MKKQIRFFEKTRLKTYISIISCLLAIFSAVAIFIPWKNYDICERLIALGVLLAVLIAVYVILYLWARNLSHLTLKVKNTKVIIKAGDILSCSPQDLKIIPVNEYFDTQVDNVIISENTLHGRFINKFYYKSQVADLDRQIQAGLRGQGNTNASRTNGKKVYYPLGTVLEVSHGYALLAFSKFNDKNEATLTREEFFDCLLSMWGNLCRLYNSRTIILPLMGAGILRFGNGALSKQEVLETILYSYRISGFNSNVTVEILLDEESLKDIDLYKLAVQYSA